MSKHPIGCLNHCPRGGGGHWLLAGVIVAVLVIVAAMARKARRGIDTGLNVAAIIGNIIMWTVVAAFVLGVVTGLGWAAWKIWRRVQAARTAEPAVLPEPEWGSAREPVHRVTTLAPAPRTIENTAPRTVLEQDRTRPEPASGYGSRAADWTAVRPCEPAQQREVDEDDELRSRSSFR